MNTNTTAAEAINETAEAAAAAATATMFQTPTKTPLWKRALKWSAYGLVAAAAVAGAGYAYSKYAGGEAPTEPTQG